MPISASSNFLLPDGTLIPEFIVFMLVLWFLSRKVLPRVNGAIENRQRQIAESLTVIDEAKSMQSDSEQRARRVTEEARAQARSIVDSANRLAQQIEASAREEALAEAGRIRARAEAEIDRARSQAAADLVAQTADMVVAAAERVLEAEIDPARHRELIERSIRAVAGAAGATGATTGAGG
jgi:F-type H+-transporting ATPase subunit b